jgi:hypothetical protein
MKRGGTSFSALLEHFDQFDVRHALLSEEKGCVAGGFGCACAA